MLIIGNQRIPSHSGETLLSSQTVIFAERWRQAGPAGQSIISQMRRYGKLLMYPGSVSAVSRLAAISTRAELLLAVREAISTASIC
jgi:hypothetical protein